MNPACAAAAALGFRGAVGPTSFRMALAGPFRKGSSGGAFLRAAPARSGLLLLTMRDLGGKSALKSYYLI